VFALFALTGTEATTTAGETVWREWTWPASIVIPLAVLGVLYLAGLMKTWEGAKRRPVNILLFVAGWTSLLIALDSPIHELGEQLFWVHMTQHEILVLVSAPLLVFSRPVGILFCALPDRFRDVLGSLSKARAVRACGAVLCAPLAAWLLHGLALWVWHAPVFFNATLESDLVHGAQHLSFLGSALLFWWALGHGHAGRLGYGGAAVYVFTTAVHTSLLGALLTFAPRAWYSAYFSTTAAWHLSPLEDQQLGGMIMWVPAGTVLTAVGLVFIWKWMEASKRQWEETATAALIRGTAGSRQ
jgi:cytochrome c oxidase assembly factor CtaG